MHKLPADQPLRVLILDDHALFRQGIVRLLEAADIEIAAACETVQEALAVIAAQTVDVVLLDYDLGRERGTDFILIAAERNLPRILVVTAGVTDRQALELMQQGVGGIFPKTDSPEMLVQAIRKVVGGDAWLKQDHLKLLLQGLSNPPDPAQKQLTARERAVLQRVVEGLANKEIAEELQISESSVKAALQQLFQKTGVRTRSQLVRIALERYREFVV